MVGLILTLFGSRLTIKSFLNFVVRSLNSIRLYVVYDNIEIGLHVVILAFIFIGIIAYSLFRYYTYYFILSNRPTYNNYRHRDIIGRYYRTEDWDRVSTILQGPRIGIESILKKDRK